MQKAQFWLQEQLDLSAHIQFCNYWRQIMKKNFYSLCCFKNYSLCCFKICESVAKPLDYYNNNIVGSLNLIKVFIKF
uniref:Uncharacterized protein n=1 Tax=Meloidogyne incognita TaxID=6306 RepID=A0A914LZ66_MELIC